MRKGPLALPVVLFLLLVTMTVGPPAAGLTGSNFESTDGNLIVDTPGNQDWENVAGRVVGIDKPSGATDDSFGQGTHEDTETPTIVSGSVPNNKSDLTRFGRIR